MDGGGLEWVGKGVGDEGGGPVFSVNFETVVVLHGAQQAGMYLLVEQGSCIARGYGTAAAYAATVLSFPDEWIFSHLRCILHTVFCS
jgi:hypothetical protein